jgi:hypothetical protein
MTAQLGYEEAGEASSAGPGLFLIRAARARSYMAESDAPSGGFGGRVLLFGEFNRFLLSEVCTEVREITPPPNLIGVRG